MVVRSIKMVVRWILSVLVAPALLIPFYIIIEWLLVWIIKIFYYICIWGTRYNVPPIGVEKQIQDLKFFITITCLSTIIASGLSGFIGGLIAPTKNSNIKSWVFGIIILPIVIYSSISFWNTEHWFYSVLWILDMIIVAIVFIATSSFTDDFIL